MSRLREIALRLEAITGELDSAETRDERVSELAAEAAELAAEAVEEANRMLRESEG